MITTHILDIAEGAPAAGGPVILEIRRAGDWSPVGRGSTDDQGRLTTLTDSRPLTPGTYRLTFDIGNYQRSQGVTSPFFPEARIAFSVKDTTRDYHIPLLVSPFGYTTYRGT